MENAICSLGKPRALVAETNAFPNARLGIEADMAIEWV